MQQLKRIFSKNPDLIKFSATKEAGVIKDVYDGTLYEEIVNKEQTKFFTFLLNTDGVELCEKSNLSIWPFFLVINELPLEIRFNFDNVIIAGKILKYLGYV